MKTNSTALAVREPAPTLVRRDAEHLGGILAQSGYFADARQAAQAAVKVMAGEELGLGPIASMTGIHIVQGKVTIGAGLIAAMIRRSGRYTYRITDHSDERCEIAFFEDGEETGRAEFTIAQAKAAGLVKAGSPWTSHPRNMLFARAISNGAKWHTPDVFTGPIYTPEEFGVDVDPQTGEVLRPEALAPVPAPTASAGPVEPAETPEPPPDKPASKSQQGFITGLIKKLAAIDGDKDWPAELEAMVGKPLDDLSAPEASRVIEAAKKVVDAHTPANPAAKKKDPDDDFAGDPGSDVPPAGQTTLSAA